MLCISACYSAMGLIRKVMGMPIALFWIPSQFVLPFISYNPQENFKILKLINIFKYWASFRIKKVIVAELAIQEVMTELTRYSVRSKEVEGICHDLCEDSGLDIWQHHDKPAALTATSVPRLYCPSFKNNDNNNKTNHKSNKKVSELLPDVMYEPRETPEAVLEK